MKISSPFQINDWEIKKFLIIVFSIQIAVLGLIILDAIGLHIPVMRQLIATIFLLFIPGTLILRVLNLHQLGNIETPLYAIGLSIAMLIMIGFFMSIIFPIFDVLRPISLTLLIIIINMTISLLSIICYIRDKDFNSPSYIEINDILSMPLMVLCLVPFLSIFGTYLMNSNHNNILQIILIVIVGLIAILIAFDKLIPIRLYPLTVFIMGLSLIFQRSLLGFSIWGGDILGEYYFANQVIQNSFWDSTATSNLAASISITLLAPILSEVLNLDLTWIFKIIYPFVFSLVPLGLYLIFQRYTNYKIAFLSCFFFISETSFYHVMPTLARQEIAEFFLVLLLLTASARINEAIKAFFLILFAFAIILSHYALSSIYILICVLGGLLVLSERIGLQKIISKIFDRNNDIKGKYFDNQGPLEKGFLFSQNFILFYIISVISWSMFIAGGHIFNILTIIGDQVLGGIIKEFGTRETTQALYIATMELSGWVEPVYRVAHIISMFLIGLGVLTLLSSYNGMKFSKDYIRLSIANFAILLTAIFVPYFGSTMQVGRIYDIVTIVLAPFFVIGGLMAFRIISRICQKIWSDEQTDFILKSLSIFLVLFLLVNTGWLNVVAREEQLPARAFAIDSSVDFPLFKEQEILGAKWLFSRGELNYPLYIDMWRHGLINQFALFEMHGIDFPKDASSMLPNSYIFLGSWNIMKDEVLGMRFFGVNAVSGYINSDQFIICRNKIFDNAGTYIYK